ncbi:hypothetical protein [Clostridioides difficile]|uniref:hypothetical protein n=1 Tax=Clostridioides difficile TaxID=1496 RepID=UPI0020B1323A|nr:hypothetical protein [Clostridioides difficile]
MKLQNIISLKGAAWIAIVSRNPNFNALEIMNNMKIFLLCTIYPIIIKYVEFLGNDIDAGFRISKQTCQKDLFLVLN